MDTYLKYKCRNCGVIYHADAPSIPPGAALYERILAVSSMVTVHRCGQSGNRTTAGVADLIGADQVND